jgi:hypothetical protein
MKRQTGHPDVEALANLRAGLVRGIHGRRIAAHVARCERCAQLSDQLSAVTWALASVPATSMPDAVGQRIGAAIAAEAAARRAASPKTGSVADPSATSLVPASPAAASPAAERRHARRWSPRPALGFAGLRLRLSPIQMLAPVAACLLLAGLGYLLSMPGPARMPSSAGPASAPRPAAAGSPKGSISRGPGRAISPTSAAGGNSAFIITVSGTRYQESTLRAQVSNQLAKQALGSSNISLAPVSTGTPGSEINKSSPGNQEGGTGRPNTGIVPSRQLVDCVMHLTRDVPPALVQRATYQTEPAYVIAVPDRAWVVHPSCTAAKPALITSVALTPAG